MFDIGWMEMMVIAVVMIVIIGPKELPGVLHSMGRWIGRVRAMARSFQDSIEEMAEESGLDEVRREVDSIRDYDIGGSIENSIDPGGEMRKELTQDGTDKAPEKNDGTASSTDGEPKKKRKAKSETNDGTMSSTSEPEDETKPGNETARTAGEKP